MGSGPVIFARNVTFRARVNMDLRRDLRWRYAAFPYTVVIAIGAALTHWLFKTLPQAERMLLSVYY